MTMATQPTAEEVAAANAVLAAANSTTGPARYKVVVSALSANNRVLFSSVSKTRAMTWLEQHCPRGEDFFLLCPDGTMMSYVQERTIGPNGEDVDQWQTFDRAAYQAPSMGSMQATSADPWADQWEAAQ
jgi:hypothetical protein